MDDGESYSEVKMGEFVFESVVKQKIRNFVISNCHSESLYINRLLFFEFH